MVELTFMPVIVINTVLRGPIKPIGRSTHKSADAEKGQPADSGLHRHFPINFTAPLR